MSPWNWSYPNYMNMSMLDWLKVLKNKIKAQRELGYPSFLLDLWPSMKLTPEEDASRMELRTAAAKLIKSKKTAFSIFTPMKDWNINKPQGISFACAFPVLSIFHSKTGFASFMLQIYTAMINLHSGESSLEKIEIKTNPTVDITFWLTKDEEDSYYMYSTGQNVYTLSPWLALQIAFLMYNLHPIVIGEQDNKPFTWLTWAGWKSSEACQLDKAPTHNFITQLGNAPSWGSILSYLGEIYSKNSMAVNNLYIWLQCVLSSHTFPQGYWEVDPSWTQNEWETALLEMESQMSLDEISFVAAITKKPVTDYKIYTLTKKVRKQLKNSF